MKISVSKTELERYQEMIDLTSEHGYECYIGPSLKVVFPWVENGKLVGSSTHTVDNLTELKDLLGIITLPPRK